MKCIECGREIDENAKFCKYCGRPIEKRIHEKRCAICGALVGPDEKFCTECGAPIESDFKVQDARKENKHVETERKHRRYFVKSVFLVMVVVVGCVLYFLLKGGERGTADNHTEVAAEEESDRNSARVQITEGPLEQQEAEETGALQKGESEETEGSQEEVLEDQAYEANERTSGEDVPAPEEARAEDMETSSEANEGVQAFYGIWIGASEEESEANRLVQKATDSGIDAKVFLTTNWSNLNSKKYYVVTAGMYASEEEANSQLASIKGMGYTDAYVKYSGEYLKK